LPISGQSSVLLIGRNGSGKSTVGLALQVLQKIARGTNRVAELVEPKDFARGRADVPMRFEIEVELEGTTYGYSLAFEFPKGFGEPRVLEEKIRAGGEAVYTREVGRVYRQIDSKLVALPIIQQESMNDPVLMLRRWLARMLILRPMPSLILGGAKEETMEPNVQVTDLGGWFSGILAYAPSAYVEIDQFLKQVMPDLQDIKKPVSGKNAGNLVVQFSADQGSASFPFEDLSDGEKCFMICALVLAASRAYGPVFCFWDEPDNFLAPSEVGHVVLALRKAFQSSGQLIATSHNTEAIRRFSDENTLLLFRNSHLEPTQVRALKDLQVKGDLVGALIRGDLEPA